MDTKNPISCVPGDSGIEEKKEGKLLQQIDAVLDIGFPPDKMPKVLNALIIKESYPGGVGYTYVICEVQRILENNRVLAIILMSDGKGTLREGMEVLDTKAPLSALKALEIDFPSGKMPKLYNALVVEGIDNNGLPITARCQVIAFLKDTNRVLAHAPSYRHIRVGMKAIDTETSFRNEEELVEAIHEAMPLTVVKGTPPYFGFDDRALCKPIMGGVESRIIWCALLLYYAIQFFRRR
ncbi:hypothetical protein RHMOL_RhmolPtG0006100 (chloroplast) [Rhododendron molle]|uniref:Uncharacterized protein n=2 Tax=Rhododendron molle TaxID=49168 RepID=A0ACC0L1V0_RHOML|nr:hypothetical protein RHMOL_RhmolPtG0005400 [Rhododendron molle]KAI8522468.1 hypothetical protein RHMOL_RhmolPtG0006100 [Rhododendron molle]